MMYFQVSCNHAIECIRLAGGRLSAGEFYCYCYLFTFGYAYFQQQDFRWLRATKSIANSMAGTRAKHKHKIRSAIIFTRQGNPCACRTTTRALVATRTFSCRRFCRIWGGKPEYTSDGSTAKERNKERKQTKNMEGVQRRNVVGCCTMKTRLGKRGEATPHVPARNNRRRHKSRMPNPIGLGAHPRCAEEGASGRRTGGAGGSVSTWSKQRGGKTSEHARWSNRQRENRAQQNSPTLAPWCRALQCPKPPRGTRARTSYVPTSRHLLV